MKLPGFCFPAPAVLQADSGIVKQRQQLRVVLQGEKRTVHGVVEEVVPGEKVDVTFTGRDTYVVSEDPIQLVEYNPYDIQLFLYGMCSFLIKAYEILPTLEIIEYQPVQKRESETETEKEPEDECPIL